MMEIRLRIVHHKTTLHRCHHYVTVLVALEDGFKQRYAESDDEGVDEGNREQHEPCKWLLVRAWDGRRLVLIWNVGQHA